MAEDAFGIRHSTLPSIELEDENIDIYRDQVGELGAALQVTVLNPSYYSFRSTFKVIGIAISRFPRILLTLWDAADSGSGRLVETFRACLRNDAYPDDLRNTATDALFLYTPLNLLTTCLAMLADERSAPFAYATLVRLHAGSPTMHRPPFGRRIVRALDIMIESMERSDAVHEPLESYVRQLKEQLSN